MNKRHDYAKLEREFITGTMSIRELCRSHDIAAHSSVVVQAQKGKWQEKREQYRAKARPGLSTGEYRPSSNLSCLSFVMFLWRATKATSSV